MPSLPATPQVIKFRVLGDADGQTIDNVFHAHYTGTAPDDTAVATLCSGFAFSFMTRFGPRLGVEYTMREVVGQDLTSPTSGSGSISGSNAGTDASGDKMPPSLALVVSWKITRRYRGGKPRTYFAPIRSDHFDTPVTFNSSYASNFASAAAGFLSDVTAISAAGVTLDALGCVSYFSGGSLRSAGLFEAFTAASVDLRPGHQRRRDGKLNLVRET